MVAQVNKELLVLAFVSENNFMDVRWKLKKEQKYDFYVFSTY